MITKVVRHECLPKWCAMNAHPTVVYPSDGFKTARLEVRDWRPRVADAGFLAALEGVLSPEVLAPLPPPLQLCESGVEGWARARDVEAAVYAVSRYEAGDLVGLVILAYDPDEARVHLGYLLAQSFWGQGYASEIVEGVLAALGSVAPVEVLGGVAHDNPASARVLVKNGFVWLADLSDGETDMFAIRLAQSCADT